MENITFGLFAAEQLTASDGTSIPADGLMETIGIDENGNAVFTTDIPCGASLYVQEIGTDDHYILSDKNPLWCLSMPDRMWRKWKLKRTMEKPLKIP